MAVTREVQTPSLFYRATGHVNRVVWQLPLPRRVLARLSRMAYRNPPMPAEAVLSVVDALEQAGVRFWLWGGWGVDALAGSESRVHRDLDLVVDHRDLTTAASTLVPLGYSEWYRIESERPLFARIVLHDHEVAGRAVDLHPVDLDRNPLAFAPGSIAGRTVSCVAPEPVEPFVELGRLFVERWPEYQPYGGAYGELVPHVTVAYGERTTTRLAEALPLRATASEVWLMARTPGSWVPKGRFALGG